MMIKLACEVITEQPRVITSSGPVLSNVGFKTCLANACKGRLVYTRAQMDFHMASREIVMVRDPGILGGTPVFRGTRVPVQTMFDYLEGGESLEPFLAVFPTVSRELAVRALEEAKVNF